MEWLLSENTLDCARLVGLSQWKYLYVIVNVDFVVYHHVCLISADRQLDNTDTDHDLALAVTSDWP